jgi:argonaute-like protein implicated in RNA metabolism and viral defense
MILQKKGNFLVNSQDSIEAIHYSEERYASLILIAKDQEDIRNINNALKKVSKTHNIEPRVCITDKGNKTEFNIEYHDDYDKESGDVFDEILKELDITHCS